MWIPSWSVRVEEDGCTSRRRFNTAKWFCFVLENRERELLFFGVLLRSWGQAMWCGCGIGAHFDVVGARELKVEENAGMLHNWKVKSALAGMRGKIPPPTRCPRPRLFSLFPLSLWFEGKLVPLPPQHNSMKHAALILKSQHALACSPPCHSFPVFPFLLLYLIVTLSYSYSLQCHHLSISKLEFLRKGRRKTSQILISLLMYIAFSHNSPTI